MSSGESSIWVDTKALPHLLPGAPQRRVVCAALRLGRRLVVAPRHHDPIMREAICNDAFSSNWRAEEIARKAWRSAEQGFIDQWGTFMDRAEAYQVAKAAGQIVYGPHLAHLNPPELDSSDLY